MHIVGKDGKTHTIKIEKKPTSARSKGGVGEPDFTLSPGEATDLKKGTYDPYHLPFSVKSTKTEGLHPTSKSCGVTKGDLESTISNNIMKSKQSAHVFVEYYRNKLLLNNIIGYQCRVTLESYQK